MAFVLGLAHHLAVVLPTFRFALDSPDKDLSFNIAACELAGHLILHDQSTFDRLTEELAMQMFRDAAVDDSTWNELLTFVRDV